MFRLRIKPKARKNLDKIPERERARIIDALDVIVAEPFFAKKLHGERKDQYSARVWPYRIIYKIYKDINEIEVIDIDHRGRVY